MAFSTSRALLGAPTAGLAAAALLACSPFGADAPGASSPPPDGAAVDDAGDGDPTDGDDASRSKARPGEGDGGALDDGSAPFPLVARDFFDRADAAVLGGAERGGTWIPGGPGNFGIASGRATATTAPGGDTYAFLPLDVRDVNVAVGDVQPRDASDSAKQALGLTVRAKAGHFYTCGIRFDGAGAQVALGRRLAGASDTQLGAPANLPVSATGRYALRLVADGANPTRLRCKAWPGGDPEPVAFQTNATDASPELQEAGALGLWHHALPATGGGQATAVTVHVDTFVAAAR